MHQSPLTRRELIKILAAASGAAALSSVPNEWKTPVVEIGALPAHAQGSSFGRITGTISALVGGPRTNAGGTPSALAGVRNSDPLPRVSILGTSLYADGSGAQGYFTYAIENVPPGTYTVRCAYYSDQDKPAIVVRGGQTTVVDFTFQVV